MLVLFPEKHFFRKMFWRIQKCKNTECRSIVLLSKKNIQCKKNGPIFITMGHQYVYGYYCPECGKYNYISDDEIPKRVQLDIRFEIEIKEPFQVRKRTFALIEDEEENEITDEIANETTHEG